MKKGWKIFWVVCAGLAVLGIVLGIGGVMLGATVGGIEEAFWNRTEAYRERSEKRVERLDDMLDSDDEEDVTYNDADSTLLGSLDGVEKLDIEMTYVEIRITEREDNGTGVLVEAENIPADVEKYLCFEQDGDELEVGIRDEGAFKSEWKKVMKNRNGILKVQIPKDKNFRSVSISCGAGVLVADRILADELDVEVGAGVAEIRDFTAREFDLECGVGEANVSGKATAESKIECGLGTVSYTAAGVQKDYSYEIECGVGSVSIGDEEYSGLANMRRIQNDGGVPMKVECGLGNVEIQFGGE